jgi:hypothetical protein
MVNNFLDLAYILLDCVCVYPHNTQSTCKPASDQDWSMKEDTYQMRCSDPFAVLQVTCNNTTPYKMANLSQVMAEKRQQATTNTTTLQRCLPNP